MISPQHRQDSDPLAMRLSRAFFATLLSTLLVIALIVSSAAGGAPLAPVQLGVAQRQPIIETLSLTGTLSSPSTAGIAPDVEGRLVEVRVEVGDHVKAGDILVKLDDELARLELQQAVAAEHEAATNLADSERRLREVRELVARQSFPESEALSLAAQVERNRAVLERRRAERAHADAMLERHTLMAPFAGVVALREADLGERVDPDSTVLRLVAVDRLQLDLRVPQGYFGRVGNGTQAKVTVDAMPEREFTTVVSRIVPVSDTSARTFLVRAYLDNSAMRMAPGMSVRVVVYMGTGRTGIVVPRDALTRFPDGRSVVWVATGEGSTRTAEERSVETGLSFDGKLEIVKGLAAGEAVVVRGNETLQQGQQVRVSEAD